MESVTAAVVVAAAAVAAAGVTFTVVMVMTMVIALDIGIVYQLTGNQSFHGCVRAAGYAAEQANAGCCQCHLRAAADAAADESICFQRGQHTGEGTVTASCGVHNFGTQNFAVLDIIDLELAGMTKMLENVSVFVCYSNSHKIFSFRLFVNSVDLMFEAGRAGAVGIFTAAKTVVTSADQQGTAFHKGIGDFLTRTGIDLLNRGAGNLHKRAALLLGITLMVDETNGFVFVYGEHHRRFFLILPAGQKGQGLGEMANLSVLSRSWHISVFLLVHGLLL